MVSCYVLLEKHGIDVKMVRFDRRQVANEDKENRLCE